MTSEIVLHTSLPSVPYVEGDQMQTKFCTPHSVSEDKDCVQVPYKCRAIKNLKCAMISLTSYIYV